MDIDTSSLNAARRNLVLISLTFILFSLGDATLGIGNGEDNTRMRLFASSITIKTDTVIIFAWVMFGWFLLRFWQFSRHKSDWSTFTNEMFYSKLMQRWYRDKELRYNSGFANRAQPVWGDWKWPSKGTIKGGEGNPAFTISKHEIFKKIKLLLYVSVTTEYFGQFYFPYCLALFALVITLL